VKDYKKQMERFNLFETDYPHYKNANSFGRECKKCYIHTYKNVHYSSNASDQMTIDNKSDKE